MNSLARNSIMALGVILFAHVSLGLPLDQKTFYSTPAQRLGGLPTPMKVAWIPTNILEPDAILRDLSTHSAEAHDRAGEKNGIGYTCRAGFIDVGHIRDAADWTAYYYGELKSKLTKAHGKPIDFILEAPGRGVDLKVSLNPKLNLEAMSLADRAQIEDKAILDLSARYAYTALAWHEVMTWFGYKTLGFSIFGRLNVGIPEKPSAFSYEDLFSNLLGTQIGIRAIQNTELEYNVAVDLEIKNLLKNLDVVTQDESLDAFDLVKNKWWNNGAVWPADSLVIGRDVNVGLSGEDYRPWLVKGFKRCANATPIQFSNSRFNPMADANEVWESHVEISPGSGMGRAVDIAEKADGEQKRIERINMTIHLPAIMKAIEDEIHEELGAQATSPDSQ